MPRLLCLSFPPLVQRSKSFPAASRWRVRNNLPHPALHVHTPEPFFSIFFSNFPFFSFFSRILQIPPASFAYQSSAIIRVKPSANETAFPAPLKAPRLPARTRPPPARRAAPLSFPGSPRCTAPLHSCQSSRKTEKSKLFHWEKRRAKSENEKRGACPRTRLLHRQQSPTAFRPLQQGCQRRCPFRRQGGASPRSRHGRNSLSRASLSRC